MDIIKKQLQEKIAKVIGFFEEEIKSIHTGRANSILVEGVKVESYGQSMRLKDVASITVPDAKSIVISPWDKSNVKAVEDALRNSDLGVGVVNSGDSIRVTLPELSTERREELKKVIGKKAEDEKVSIRNARRDAVDAVKKQEKDKEIGEDQAKRAEGEIQKMVDDGVKQIDVIAEAKEKELSL